MTASANGNIHDNADAIEAARAQAGPAAGANGEDRQEPPAASGPPPQTDASADPIKDSPPLGVDARANDQEITKPPRLHEPDASGCEIKNIFASTRQFFIYEADNQIRYMLPENYNVAKALRLKIADLGGLRASIEDLRADPSLSPSEKTRAAREISWALAQAFEYEAKSPSEKPSEMPKEILTRVDARLRSLVKSHYRKKYVLANLVAFAAIEVFLILVALVFSHAWILPGNMGALHRYAIYGAVGGLGAFLSVITGIRSIEVDINLKVWEHIFAGATRILIGVVGALVIGLALDSSFIDPTFGNSPAASPGTAATPGSLDKRVALNLLFAFIAGFSESLVPNLLSRGEQAAGSSERQNTPADPIVRTMNP